jgi:hypothetical protein
MKLMQQVAVILQGIALLVAILFGSQSIILYN